jgi:hypothetical protein
MILTERHAHVALESVEAELEESYGADRDLCLPRVLEHEHFGP